MLITAHSPYVLTKLNNLLKAGSIAEHGGEKTRQKLTKVVGSKSWLTSGVFTAYAIISGESSCIMDDDGMINGKYLDSISEEISNEFLSILDAEDD
jgi:hypothetical protein